MELYQPVFIYSHFGFKICGKETVMKFIEKYFVHNQY